MLNFKGCIYTLNNSGHNMAGILDILLGLLLLPFVKTGINGEDNLILAGRGYTISSPCNGPLDLICYVIWQFSTTENSAYIAVVSNGVIQAAKSKAKGRRPRSKCALNLRNLTTEDVGHFRCHKRQSIYSPLNSEYHQDPKFDRISLTSNESNVMPGQTVTLHCALLTNRRRRFCGTQQHRDIRLKWVDEAGDDVLEDSQHQIWPQSPCDVTLTVALQRDDRRKFKCQATVNEEFTAKVILQCKQHTRHFSVKSRST
uniref:Ig-like domain-containing protein n=1 Tax=Myripristis murdjan TaxID=586833 RepID=A0A667Y920_9TELE